MAARIRTVESFRRAARLLEDAFFLAQDSVLVERLRAMQKMQESKEALATVSGITNDAILSRLVQLDVRPETVAALATVPLIEVAWADGEVDRAERDAVLAHANTQGIRPGSMEHELLERWLTHRPDPTLFDAWRAYLTGLCEQLDEAERELLKEELLHATKATANSSGGLFGIGSISRDEQDMLDRLAASFCCVEGEPEA